METDERITQLRAELRPIAPDDPMPEAGRKALLAEFVRMLQHEAGSRTGEDIEDVHDMRVATRRMRSTLRLLRQYYRSRAVAPYKRQLRKIARALGEVRDLDVLIADLSQQPAADDEHAASRQSLIEALDRQRAAARADLVAQLDKRAYRRFVTDFSDFLTTTDAGTRRTDNRRVTPLQVRHVLPGIIYERLAAVLAYDTVVEGADASTLHGLRIEFKRLRYAVSVFEEVLGTPIKDFIEDLKVIQDHLGRMQDIAIAQQRLESMQAHAGGQLALEAYRQHLDAEAQALLAQFPAAWARFNSRRVQRKLSSALLALR